MSCRKPAAPENKKKKPEKNTGKRNALGMHFLYQLISGSAKKKEAEIKKKLPGTVEFPRWQRRGAECANLEDAGVKLR